MKKTKECTNLSTDKTETACLKENMETRFKSGCTELDFSLIAASSEGVVMLTTPALDMIHLIIIKAVQQEESS